MKYLNYLIAPVFILLLLHSCEQELEEIALSSPDLRLQLIFHLEEGKPTYHLTYNGKLVFMKSDMGFTLKDLPPLDSNFILLGKYIHSEDDTREQAWGETRYIQNKYRELMLYLQEADGSQRKMNIVFRLYNDGFAFRYEFPEQEFLDEFPITEEKTNFVFPANDTCWWIPAKQIERTKSLYNKTLLSEVDTARTPLTIGTSEGLFLSFHEAQWHDYLSYTLYSSDTHVLSIDLVPWKNGIKANLETPFSTPWRAVQIENEQQQLITNYLILNLKDTCKLSDSTWGKPDEYEGFWWGMPFERKTWIPGDQFTIAAEGTSLARQLASYITNYSPYEITTGMPANSDMDPVSQFIRNVPCDWEETIALNGEIGKYVTIVRKDRNSEEWYLGSITDEKPRTFGFKLNFLESGKEYKTRIHSNSTRTDRIENPLDIVIHDTIFTHSDSLFVQLAPGGGQAIRFIPLLGNGVVE